MSDPFQQPEQENTLPVLRPHALQPNPYFTGYDPLLASMPHYFEQTPLLILSGSEGIGKTQIAQEYACRSAERYETIIWLTVSSRALLSQNLNGILDWSASSRTSWIHEDETFTILKDWLRTHPNWLLVLDHLDDFSLLDLIIPPDLQGHLLMTTRQTFAQLSLLFSQSPSVLSEATRRSLHHAQTLVIGPSSSQPAEKPTDLLFSQRIPSLFVPTLGVNLTNALAGFEQWLTEGRGSDTASHQEGVAILAEEFAEFLTPSYVDVLRVLTFLHPATLPQELLLEAATEELPEALPSLFADPALLKKALHDLVQTELLIPLKEDETLLHLHPGLEMVLVSSLTAEEQRVWANLSIFLVNSLFPVVRFDTRDACQRALPLAQRCSTLITKYQLTSNEGALLLERLGTFLLRQASYTEAETALTQALGLYKDHLDANSLDAAQTMNSLGLLYSELARYQEAEAVNLRALEIREQELGSEHATVAESLHNLALIAINMGQYQRAEELSLRVLSLEERSKGPDHVDVAATLNNLGLLYYHQGRDAPAETAYRRALTIYDYALPSDHPDRAYPLDGLGALAERQGKTEVAEALYQEALVICQHAFGELHPETASSITTLADIAESRGNDHHAQELYQHALSIYEQISGSEHPLVADVLNNLAFLATKQGHDVQAEPLYQKALNIYERTYGPEHPLVADVLNNQGQLFRKSGDLDRAEALLRRAVALCEQALGATHPHTIQSLVNLVGVLTEQHRDEEAEALLQQPLLLLEPAFAPEHPQIVHVQKAYKEVRARLDSSEEPPTKGEP